MNTDTLAIIIQEGSKLVGEIIRNKVVLFAPSKPSKAEVERPKPAKSKGVATGCIPCSIGHLGTCSGLLNEAMQRDPLLQNMPKEKIPELIDSLLEANRHYVHPGFF